MRQTLGSFDLACASVEEALPRPTGTLRISVPSSFGRRYIMSVVAEYMRTYPLVRLDIRFTEQVVNLVEEGLELALRIGNLGTSTLVARRLGFVRRHLVASPAYLRDRPMPKTPDDLADHQCVVYSRISPVSEWTFGSEHGRHVAVVRKPVLVDDADAMQEAVTQNLGIAILPHWNAAVGLRSGEMLNLLPEYSIAALPLHAVYPEAHWMSPRARSFLDLLIKGADRFSN